jgi:hypothetical protein
MPQAISSYFLFKKPDFSMDRTYVLEPSGQNGFGVHRLMMRPEKGCFKNVDNTFFNVFNVSGIARLD